ncbi:protein Mo25 isoform X1 [Eurytemora carolleeae]|uniref:protein Mo25 isoform X1 n=1 Tax=Eurytemora carolleeae TaxID=1294199 RepID=UPI000C789650|nr:protein Mo25 isoform X1 [Eurytemora carolleeae]|eukprot:XP_023325835.1 protein Mo25-like isoform X1 [Eurytemora affinis]
MPIFGRSKSSPDWSDLGRVCVDLLESLPRENENEHLREIFQTIRTMKDTIMNSEADEQTTFWQETYSSGFLLKVLPNLRKLDFEAKKDVRQIFFSALQRRIGTTYPTVDYILEKPEILNLLCAQYESQGDGLNTGPILRECLSYPELTSVFLASESLYKLFSYCELPTFDTASDAFCTLRLVLTKHKKLSSEFLNTNYERFFQRLDKMILSENYATRRQFIKLLSDILLERTNFTVMSQYISNPHHLKTVMGLLKDKSPSIQYEAFHVFKILAANPRKPESVVDILTRNKSKLIKLLTNFLPDRNSEVQFSEDKEYLLKQIESL